MYYTKKILSNKKFLIIFSIIIILILVTIFANYIAPYNPLYQDYNHILEAPNTKFLLGTDYTGRDVLSRIIYGGRTSLIISIIVTFLVSSIGIIVGIFSGYIGGVVDTFLMRLVDMIMAFPYIVFVIAIVSVFGGGLKNLIIAMTLISWTNYARVTRAMIISIKKSDYIKTAKLNGNSNIQVITRYLIPNTLPYLITIIAQDIANNLLTLSSLSLLGIGVQPPTPEWGLMLTEGKKYMQSAPWLLFYPGLAILINVVLFNLLGEVLQETLNPKD